jgi:hypothetical protein
MATISKIKVGQILYDKHKYRMGNTTIMTYGLWKVYVKEVDPNGKFIIASWNGNKPTIMYEYQVKKLKVKEPVMPKSRW